MYRNKAKAIAITVHQGAFAPVGNFFHDVLDAMYGSPERTRMTLTIALAILAVSFAVHGMSSSCAIDALAN